MFGYQLNDFDYDFNFKKIQTPLNNNSTQSPQTCTVHVDYHYEDKSTTSSNEAYQLFKDSVDLAYSGNVFIQDQPAFLDKIQNDCENIIIAFKSEKGYLLSEVLYQWKVKQQKLSVGCVWIQTNHQNQMKIIDSRFECFEELLDKTLTGLEFLVAEYPNEGFEKFYTKIKKMANSFLNRSVIVSQQPPSVVIKCGVAKKPRRSRFWFNSEICVLGGRALGIHHFGEGLPIKCKLITEETAAKVFQDADEPVVEDEEFLLELPIALMKMEEHGLAAKFEDMRIVSNQKNKPILKKKHSRRKNVTMMRYRLFYAFQIQAKHGINLITKNVSLPFAILCGPKFDVEAMVFLERSFADFVQNPFSFTLPTYVSSTEMADALEMKYHSEIESPPKHTNFIPPIQPIPLTPQAKDHILRRLKPDNHGQIKLDSFINLKVANDFCIEKKKWELASFYVWFFKCSDFINKHLQQMWKDRLIYGFCSKDVAEQLLRETERPTLLIKFSDMECGKLEVIIKDRMGVITHLGYECKDMTEQFLNRELLSYSTFYGIEYIYPNFDFARILEKRIPQNNEYPKTPQFEQLSPEYF